ncbi:MAG: 50S ribosomal protein L29 [Clostridiales bacterium]|nr:50S ribosomal protein L29 [Clostridiales bacterium]
MTIKEIRKLSPDVLDSRLKDARQELMNLRFQHAVSQLENPLKIVEAKKTVARLLTVIRENELKSKARA